MIDQVKVVASVKTLTRQPDKLGQAGQTYLQQNSAANVILE